jgi:hypothetical protein
MINLHAVSDAFVLCGECSVKVDFIQMFINPTTNNIFNGPILIQLWLGIKSALHNLAAKKNCCSLLSSSDRPTFDIHTSFPILRGHFWII